MGLKATLKAIEAAKRRDEREAKRKARELEKQLKEQAKLSELQQAKLEVETFENELEILTSIHQENCMAFDWEKAAATLPPPSPVKLFKNGIRAALNQGNSTAEQLQSLDESEYQSALQEYMSEKEDAEKLRDLAHKVLLKDINAYARAVDEYDPFEELTSLGSQVRVAFHGSELMECLVRIKGQHVIPKDRKTLTASGKLSIKPMAKSFFHEVYQDYVCGTMLRVAREGFAFLPVETILVTATVEVLPVYYGTSVDKTVMSVAMPRSVVEKLHFDHIDPSDAMELFLCRGDAKASRKSGEFESIVPLTVSDVLMKATGRGSAVHELLAAVKEMREKILCDCEKLRPKA